MQAELNLGGLSLQGTWKPSQVERGAAGELYVELVPRVTVVPLQSGEGLLWEALTRLDSLSGTTREVLPRHGPEVGELAVLVLNYEVRPLLARWHPLLEQWETDRPTGTSRAAYEDVWPHAGQLGEQLEVTHRRLVDYDDLLTAAAHVPPLAVPTND